MPQTILYIIIAILLFDYILERWLDYLNAKSFSPTLPLALKDIYDEKKYAISQQYEKEKKKVSSVASSLSLLVMLVLLLTGSFGKLYEYVLTINSDTMWSTLIFFAVLAIASDIVSLPFSIYGTFVIEEKFGFNRTTVKTFIADKLKGYLLGAMVGGGLLSAFVLLYEIVGQNFWMYMLMVMAFFMVVTNMFYASWILPMFNKLTPLADGELRTAIEAYCKKENFKLDNLFVMDGSKRSSKANAFFSGLGAKKKIVLFDTLVNNYSVSEVVAVLAHEVGHYKKKHTRTGLVLGLIQITLMLYLFSVCISLPALSIGLGASRQYFPLGLMAFAMLYSPVSTITGILMNMLSRKHEFEADAFAKTTYDAQPLISSLKKLSVDSLSNLQPHPIYVFFYYSHPPLLQRINALTK